MSKRKFTYNFPSTVENAVKEYGTRPQTTLNRECFNALGEVVRLMEAIEEGDANSIQTCGYELLLCAETILRTNARFHNVDDDLYIKVGRDMPYDDGVDVAMWFEVTD